MNTKPLFLLTHLGLGDLILSLPMMRVLSQQTLSLRVVVKSQSYKLLRDLCATIPNIDFFQISDDNEISPVYGGNPSILTHLSSMYTLLLCGSHRHPYGLPINDFNEFPFNFYKDIGLPPRAFWDHAGLPETPASQALYDSILSDSGEPYAILHSTYSGGDLFTVGDVETRFGINRNTTLVLDFSKNHYEPTHHYYERAQRCVLKPFTHYVTLFNRASLIVLSDSSLWCMAVQLPLSTDECYVVPRGETTFTHMYEPAFGYDPLKHPQRKFKHLRFQTGK